MKIQCPKCRQAIPAAQINVATDLALCPACHEGFRASQCLDAEAAAPALLQSPPPGAWFTEDFDRATVGATTRSWAAFLLVPFMCVWSGFSLGGIYGRQIIQQKFDLFHSLFGIPFLLGSILFWSLALMTICGKVELRIEGGQATVFTGVGRMGWRKRFDWTSVTSIQDMEHTAMNYPGKQSAGIVVEGSFGSTRFGSGLNHERRDFVVKALRHLRLKRP